MEMVAHVCHPSHGRKPNMGRLLSKMVYVKCETLSPNQPEQEGLEVRLKYYSTILTSTKPCVQIPPKSPLYRILLPDLTPGRTHRGDQRVS
jgi:hypothetical protein